MINDTFANRLAKALKDNDLRPVDLSRKTGISKTQISFWLSGRYKAKQDSLTKLAQALHTNAAWLMGYDVPISRDTATIKVELVGYEEIIKQLEHISSLLEKIN